MHSVAEDCRIYHVIIDTRPPSSSFPCSPSPIDPRMLSPPRSTKLGASISTIIPLLRSVGNRPGLPSLYVPRLRLSINKQRPDPRWRYSTRCSCRVVPLVLPSAPPNYRRRAWNIWSSSTNSMRFCIVARTVCSTLCQPIFALLANRGEQVEES